ncbi:hypothetical protein [Flagellimonas onchidii]|uniref:hypothetical protein n=1 Tax=Flagellimonas onchidii TaxID=2562684 RepID=UPI0010A61AC0|nr:hypothetical protein [Allomuricauda onchidii]
MEKLCYRLILFLFVPVSFYGQRVNSLLVFSSKGDIINMKTREVILKGDILKKQDVLLLDNEASITAIDADGQAYTYEGEAKCRFADLLEKKKKLNNLTVRYFQFIYQEFTGQQPKESVMAGVYRGNDLLITPPDSAMVSNRNLRFFWEHANTNFYYFFLRNKTTEEIFKIGVSGTQIKLYEEKSIFKGSTQFEWTVDTREYPDLKNIGWNRFEIKNYKEVETELLRYEKFIEDMKVLGFSKNEVTKRICESYGVCK